MLRTRLGNVKCMFGQSSKRNDREIKDPRVARVFIYIYICAFGASEKPVLAREREAR